MDGKRTPADWSRLLLAIGIGILLLDLAGLLGLFAIGPGEGCFGCRPTELLPIPLGPLLIPTQPPFVPLAGLLVGVFGLVWMVRILRGPRDEPPPWRHRDR